MSLARDWTDLLCVSHCIASTALLRSRGYGARGFVTRSVA